MYMMFGDEADHEGRPGCKYFLYGGIFVPVSNALKLHDEIANIRTRYGFAATDSLKFSTSTRPENVSRENHTLAKTEVIEAAIKHDIKFSAYVFLHSMAKNLTHDDLVNRGSNSILGSFNKFLKENSSYGISVLDRLPVRDQFKYMEDKFCIGLEVHGKDKPISLERIIAHTVSCNNASHFSSVVDILLGSFRYCVNEEDKDIACRSMLPKVVQTMWSRRSGDRLVVREYGLLLRPKEIRVESYREEYEKLVARLTSMLQPAH